MDQEKSSNQLPYAQQHLANERTYLAWIRTGISIVGVGFLATSLYFNVGVLRNVYIDTLSLILGIFSCLLGIFVIVITTQIYYEKRRQIMDGVYYPNFRRIAVISTLLIIFILLILSYFFYIFWSA